jgi:hypothetical protein
MRWTLPATGSRLQDNGTRHVTSHRPCAAATPRRRRRPRRLITHGHGPTHTEAAPARVALPLPHARWAGRTRDAPHAAVRGQSHDVTTSAHRLHSRSQIPFRPPKQKHYYQEADAGEPLESTAARAARDHPTHRSRPAAEMGDGRERKPTAKFYGSHVPRRAACRSRCPHAPRLAPPPLPPTAARVRPPPPVAA